MTRAGHQLPGERRDTIHCPLGREFFGQDSRDLAPRLLGKILTCRGASGRIVEVEAYAGSEDPGSHAFRGQTPRTEIMFGPAGYLYVYFSYGMHWCANVVCGSKGIASAVLLRALAPLEGLEQMQQRRPKARKPRDLCSGPAKLCQALGIDKNDNGADLVSADRGISITDDGATPPSQPGQSPRIGLSAGQEHPWRWFVTGDINLSRPGR